MCGAWLRILLALALRFAGGQQCGIPGGLTKIVGGEPVESLEFPWYVALVPPSASVSSQVSCGGSLITSRHVLSAAHCFPRTSGVRPEQLYRAVLGLVNRCSQKNPEQATIASVLVHPDYDSGTLVADIAVITLDRAVSYTPICLPRKNYVPSGSALVIGFGSTLAKSQYPCTLQKAEVNILRKRQCAHSGLASEYSHIPGTICAGVASGGVDSCDGDSGGPLMTIGQGGAYYVQGIVSFGEGCARKNLPGVYTQASYYRSFIDSAIKSTEDLLDGEGEDVSSTLIPLGTKEPPSPIPTSSEDLTPLKPSLSAPTLSPLDTLLTLLLPWFDADSSSGGDGSSSPSVSGAVGTSRPISPLEYFLLQIFNRNRHRRVRPS